MAKGFLPIPVILALTIIVLVSSGFYFTIKNFQKDEPKTSEKISGFGLLLDKIVNQATTSTTQPTPTPTPTPTSTSTPTPIPKSSPTPTKIVSPTPTSTTTPFPNLANIKGIVFILRDLTVCNVSSTCYSLKLNDTETANIKREVNEFVRMVNNWGVGKINVQTQLIEITPNHQVEMEKIFFGGIEGWWLPPSRVRNLTKPHISKSIDFSFVIHTTHDNSAKKQIPNNVCDFSPAADSGIGGAGYSWIPKTTPAESADTSNCAQKKTMIHSFLHHLDWSLQYLSGVEDIYNNNFPQSLCGKADSNALKWFPSPDYAPQDPDFPPCATHYGSWIGYCNSIKPRDCDFEFDQHLLERHYPEGAKFIGNYCRDGKQNFSETGIDSGGECG